MSEKAQILIAGAGIAGLTAALALARRGMAVTVAETFEQPSEVGAGLQVAPNASRILRSLGVLEALEEKAVAPSSIRLGDAPTGRIVLDLAITPAWLKRMDAPYLTAHRASLHGVLYAAAMADPSITILTGHRVTKIREDDDRVTAMFDSGGEETELAANILIGADGIWSAVRAAVPGAAQPKPTGRVAWRVIAPSSRSAQNSVTAWMAPDSHVVTYPVRNSETLNIVAITHGRMKDGDWAQQADDGALKTLTDTLGRIAGVEALDRAKWTAWPLNTIDASASWSSGRVLLIGDAAHGLEPFAAQGAAMAIEDAYAAAKAIAVRRDDPAGAFADYRALRLDRILRVAKRTAFNRWTYHQGGAGRLARNMFFSMRSAESFLADLDWLYGYRFDD